MALTRCNQWYVRFAMSIQCLNFTSRPAISLIFQLTIWFVDSFIENCVATAFLGLLYGPMYVDGLAIVKELLPEDLHMISMQIG